MIRHWSWIAAGVCVAALVAGGLVGLEFAGFIWVASLVEGGSPDGIVPFGLLAAFIASIGFFVGLVFPGIPILLFLYSSGKRSWRTALVVGTLSASIAGMSLSAPAG